ncbi:MAG: hypothetical protein DME26_01910 [Verrucomicrobia bacterium]|nr:MAG: hypothetical protein DME26_01910 [Verrucomicrobiota bacterium]
MDTPVGSLTLSAGSSDPTLVPTNNIVFGGSGSNRTVTVTPAVGQSGTATISVTVDDGQLSASTNFVLTVSASFVGTRSITNSAAITIPSQGAGTPYPSTISVSGMGGNVSNVTVTLRGLTHSWGDDIDVLLVGPGGQKVTLMSDAGTGPTASGANLTFSDGAAGMLPQTGSLVSGTYRPTDYAPTDTYPSPAPTGPYGTNLTAFNGTAPNGTWSVYVVDDGAGDQGSFAGGWSVSITTAGAAASLVAGPPALVWIENPPKITSITFDHGTIQLIVNGEVGLRYALEASRDLVNWTKLAVQDNTTGSVVFSDRPTTNAIRFYRAVSTAK